MPKSKIIYLILFLSLAYFPLFYNLDVWSLRKWDEARNAVGAINMMDTGDYLVRQYNDKIDTWETKPPMLLWCQIISMKIFGETMWAIRFPSALATLILLIAIIFFCGRILNDWTAGFLSALALLVSDGFIKAHVSRTGDHDALLAMFLLFSLFSFYKYLKINLLANILAASFFTFLAVLTKSIIGLMFLPGLFVYLIYSRKLLFILRGCNIYWAIFGLFLSIFAYYFIAEWTHPNYLKAVWQMELLPRFQNIEGKYIKPEKWHYLKILTNEHRFPFWFLLPFCLFFTTKSKNNDLKDFVKLPVSIALVFSLIMSHGIWYDWYDAPLYPLWALIFGCGMSEIFKRIHLNLLTNEKKQLAMIISLFLSICIYSKPYYNVTKRIYENFTIQKPNEQYGEFIQKRLKSGQKCDFSILYSNVDAYDAPMQFYQKVLRNKGQKINLIYIDLKIDSLSKNPLGLLNRDSITIDKSYLCCHTALTDSIKKYFGIHIFEEIEDCTFFEIKHKKDH